MTEEEIKALIIQEVVKQLTGDIYTDALKPGVSEVGKALGTIGTFGNTILTPLSMLNDSARFIREKNALKLEHKLKQIQVEHLKEINPSIGVPVLRKLEYTEDEELVELYLNLLSRAADEKNENLSHPSFVNIINNLSTDEAKILKFIHNEDIGICTQTISIRYNNGTYSDHQHDTSIFEIHDLITFKNNMKVYLSNLSSLGIIKSFGIPTGQDHYKLIEDFLTPTKDVLLQEKKNVSEYTFTRNFFALTEFGKLFLSCCLPKE